MIGVAVKKKVQIKALGVFVKKILYVLGTNINGYIDIETAQLPIGS